MDCIPSDHEHNCTHAAADTLPPADALASDAKIAGAINPRRKW